MGELFRAEYAAKIDSLSSILKNVLSAAKTAGVTEKRQGQLELCLEEAVVNVFDHSHRDNDEPVTIEVIVMLERETDFSVLISDNGVPFDPLSAPEPDLDADIEDRKIGGLGIHFIKNMMDDVRYERSGGKNRFTLTIKKELK